MKSKKYIAYVKGHVCMFCGQYEVDAHHFGKRGMSQKASDLTAVPVCHEQHQEFHTTGAIKPFTADATKTYFYQEQVRLLSRFIKEGMEP